MSVEIRFEPSYVPHTFELNAQSGNYQQVHFNDSGETQAVVVYSRVRYRAILEGAVAPPAAGADNYHLRDAGGPTVWYLAPGLGMFAKSDTNSAGDCNVAVYNDVDPADKPNATSRVILTGLPTPNM